MTVVMGRGRRSLVVIWAGYHTTYVLEALARREGVYGETWATKTGASGRSCPGVLMGDEVWVMLLFAVLHGVESSPTGTTGVA